VQSEKRAPVEPEIANQRASPAAPQLSAQHEQEQEVQQEQTEGGFRSAWGPETDTVSVDSDSDSAAVPEPQVSVAPTYQSSSLAQSETKLRTPEDLKKETSSVASDPLYTSQVDDGLNQLLTDWTLFKKSGLFGTGAKGMNHPLYLQIKDFQIPLLLAGRFEGATQEIKQSITDYMNGWRYEQGIVYNQGENFDHYLRRVILHILNLHKKS
jgi:hypothetical protein